MSKPRWLAASAVAATLALALPAVPMQAHARQTATDQSSASANEKKAKKHAKKAAAETKGAVKDAGKATADETRSVARPPLATRRTPGNPEESEEVAAPESEEVTAPQPR